MVHSHGNDRRHDMSPLCSVAVAKHRTTDQTVREDERDHPDVFEKLEKTHAEGQPCLFGRAVRKDTHARDVTYLRPLGHVMEPSGEQKSHARPHASREDHVMRVKIL